MVSSKILRSVALFAASCTAIDAETATSLAADAAGTMIDGAPSAAFAASIAAMKARGTAVVDMVGNVSGAADLVKHNAGQILSTAKEATMNAKDRLVEAAAPHVSQGLTHVANAVSATKAAAAPVVEAGVEMAKANPKTATAAAVVTMAGGMGVAGYKKSETVRRNVNSVAAKTKNGAAEAGRRMKSVAVKAKDAVGARFMGKVETTAPERTPEDAENKDEVENDKVQMPAEVETSDKGKPSDTEDENINEEPQGYGNPEDDPKKANADNGNWNRNKIGAACALVGGAGAALMWRRKKLAADIEDEEEEDEEYGL